MTPNDLFLPSSVAQDKALAAKGDIAATMRLGYGYCTGCAGVRALARARTYFQSVAAKAPGAAALLAYTNLRDPFSTAASKANGLEGVSAVSGSGDPVAQTLQGRVYERGLQGGDPDPDHAVALYQSAHTWFALAKTYLGTLYERQGKISDATSMLSTAASIGDTTAMVRLAELYLRYHSPQTRVMDAKRLLRTAVMRQDATGMYRLAVLYYRDGLQGSPSAFGRAFTLFQHSSAIGYLKSTAAMGICYTKGTGVAADESVAQRLLMAGSRYAARVTDDLQISE